jgi:hypothetical protein
LIRRDESGIYVDKANRVTVRHRHGDVVAIIEIVSPGNKANSAEFSAFVQKLTNLMHQGIHLLVIDLFPPGRRDPKGIHAALWGAFQDEDVAPPADKPLTLVAYNTGPPRMAYVDFVAVGNPLPEASLFLEPELYVLVPLEATYQTTWQGFPTALKGLLEPPAPDRPAKS